MLKKTRSLILFLIGSALTLSYNFDLFSVLNEDCKLLIGFLSYGLLIIGLTDLLNKRKIVSVWFAVSCSIVYAVIFIIEVNIYSGRIVRPGVIIEYVLANGVDFLFVISVSLWVCLFKTGR